MAPDKIARIKAIAERTWLRTLSDRIGISHDEKERKKRTPEPALPVSEYLLSDKPEHIFTRSHAITFLQIIPGASRSRCQRIYITAASCITCA
jgi:hypothetical protein